MRNPSIVYGNVDYMVYLVRFICSLVKITFRVNVMTLMVTEIFFSIQGEALWSGLPCVFVRLSGCNLRCRYCDTTYAYAPGDPMTADEIIDRVKHYQCPRITLTGGEPLLQQETPALTAQLIDSGYDVSMETNGSLEIDLVDQRCIRIVDIKCPFSGMQKHNRMKNLSLLSHRDQIKFVIANEEDFQFASAIADRLSPHVEAERIWFSPVQGILAADQLAAWMLESNSHGRLNLQLHKILWPNQDRGV